MSGGNMPRRKGDVYERKYVDYLVEFGVVGARRAKRGNNSGDVAGTPQLVSECKAGNRLDLATWVDQMLLEKLACGAEFGAVVARRKGKGDIGQHYFVMTVHDGLLLCERAGIIEVSRAVS